MMLPVNEIICGAMPEASEFTKRYREFIKISEDHLSKNKIGRLQSYGKEACDILDSQAAEIKKYEIAVKKMKQILEEKQDAKKTKG